MVASAAACLTTSAISFSNHHVRRLSIPPTGHILLRLRRRRPSATMFLTPFAVDDEPVSIRDYKSSTNILFPKFRKGLLGVGSFFVIRQVLVRRELDLSAKELQEQVRSGDATATEYFELGAVMLRRKFYPAAIKYLQQAIEKWDRDEQDLSQVYNALGVSYVRDDKLDKGIAQFEKAVKLQPGYVTAWNNLGDAYEKKKELRAALKAFEEVLVFDPSNKIAWPRRDALRDRVKLYKGVSIKSEER